MWAELTRFALFAWFVVAAAITVAHYGLYRWYSNSMRLAALTPTPVAIQIWIKRFVGLVLCSVVSWVVFTIYFLPVHNIGNRLSVVTLLVVYVTGSMAFLSPHRWAFRILAPAILLPLAINLLTSGARAQVMLSAAIAALLIALVFVHHRLHMALRQALTLNAERENSSQLLASEKDKVSNVNAALADEIVNRLHAENNERYVRERLAMHLERTPLGVVDLDASGHILQWNPSAHAMFGLSAESVMGKLISETIVAQHDRIRFEIFMQDVTRSRESLQSAFACLTPSSRFIHCEFNATPWIDREGKVIGVAALIQDVTERMHTERTIQYMSMHDSLTGLPNRRLLQDRLGQAIAQARRAQHFLALLSIDIDRFKLINDSLGHEQGDAVLKEVARRLKVGMRDSDTVTRESGDEFIVLLTDLEKPEAAKAIADKLSRDIAKPFTLGSQELHITVSIGISLFPADATDAQQLLKNAESAMYTAKESGRNTVRFFTADLSELLKKRLEAETRLRKSVERKEFSLSYQPQLSVLTNEIVACEALLRWHDPERGEVFPDEFIHLAEELGLIFPLGEWVFGEVCKQQIAWAQQGLKDIRISVNLSARQFLSPKLVSALKTILDDTNANANLIELEITETVLMRNIDQAIDTLKQLKTIGLKVAIDDFGMGYSSLAQLSNLPADSLKIDQCFLHDVPDDASNTGITEAVIAIAKRLKLCAIAEGVETQAQLDFLKRNQCDVYQGFLASHAIRADAVLAMWAAKQTPVAAIST